MEKESLIVKCKTLFSTKILGKTKAISLYKYIWYGFLEIACQYMFCIFNKTATSDCHQQHYFNVWNTPLSSILQPSNSIVFLLAVLMFYLNYKTQVLYLNQKHPHCTSRRKPFDNHAHLPISFQSGRILIKLLGKLNNNIKNVNSIMNKQTALMDFYFLIE